jgi:RNA polymerase sigma factor (TIGR02999 family)
MHDENDTGQGEVTRLLISWRDGDPRAAEALFTLLYHELRALARRQIRRPAGESTLNTTALVHEAYLKLVDGSRVNVRDRGHFFALAARVMRQILVDHARSKAAAKRGGNAPPAPLDENLGGTAPVAEEVLGVDEALKKLEALDPRLGKLVELRFYAGLSVEECAEILETSPRTVKRDWQKARAFLYHELGRQGAP